jgi:uncharacterized membrane protein
MHLHASRTVAVVDAVDLNVLAGVCITNTSKRVTRISPKAENSFWD